MKSRLFHAVVAVGLAVGAAHAAGCSDAATSAASNDHDADTTRSDGAAASPDASTGAHDAEVEAAPSALTPHDLLHMSHHDAAFDDAGWHTTK